MFAMSMPNAVTAFTLVLTATKCFSTASRSFTGFKAFSSQAFRLSAFVIVSWVVKVFEQTITNVSAGSRSRVISAKSVPSTFERKRKSRSRCE